MPAGPEHGAGRLAALLARLAAGQYPPPDGGVTILPQPSPRDAGVLSLTAHAVIFTDAGPGFDRWVRAQLPDGDLAAPMSPQFLQALGTRTGRRANTIDMLCLAGSRPGPPAIGLSPAPAVRHPRGARALRCRDDVRAWQADGGVMVIGRGVAGRWEVAIEVDPGRRGQGLGRELATAARHLIPEDAGTGRVDGSGLRSRRATRPVSGPSSPRDTSPSVPRPCSSGPPRTAREVG
jgi:GNAT superfamily N-acetyltransferase